MMFKWLIIVRTVTTNRQSIKISCILSQCCLSNGNALQKFIILLTPIQDFLETKATLAKYSIIKDKRVIWFMISHRYHTAYEWAKSESPSKRKAYLWLS